MLPERLHEMLLAIKAMNKYAAFVEIEKYPPTSITRLIKPKSLLISQKSQESAFTVSSFQHLVKFGNSNHHKLENNNDPDFIHDVLPGFVDMKKAVVVTLTLNGEIFHGFVLFKFDEKYYILQSVYRDYDPCVRELSRDQLIDIFQNLQNLIQEPKEETYFDIVCSKRQFELNDFLECTFFFPEDDCEL